jgi:hypothetical protein
MPLHQGACHCRPTASGMSAASERQLGAIVADAGQVGELDHRRDGGAGRRCLDLQVKVDDPVIQGKRSPVWQKP